MAEKEIETVSSKLNVFLEKNRKIVLSCFIVVLVAIVVFVVAEIAGSVAKDKNLAAVDALTYELTNGSAALEEDELNARIEDALTKIVPYTKKGGVAGVRANLLAAELAYEKEDYNSAVAYWDAAASKGKKSYTAPLANFNKGVCYEELNDLDNAAAAYKLAADAEDFILKSHAKFSYGRVLESQGNYSAAVEVYQSLVADYESDSWADLAKTRILSLQIEGKAE